MNYEFPWDNQFVFYYNRYSCFPRAQRLYLTRESLLAWKHAANQNGGWND